MTRHEVVMRWLLGRYNKLQEQYNEAFTSIHDQKQLIAQLEEDLRSVNAWSAMFRGTAEVILVKSYYYIEGHPSYLYNNFAKLCHTLIICGIKIHTIIKGHSHTTRHRAAMLKAPMHDTRRASIRYSAVPSGVVWNHTVPCGVLL